MNTFLHQKKNIAVRIFILPMGRIFVARKCSVFFLFNLPFHVSLVMTSKKKKNF